MNGYLIDTNVLSEFGKLNHTYEHERNTDGKSNPQARFSHLEQAANDRHSQVRDEPPRIGHMPVGGRCGKLRQTEYDCDENESLRFARHEVT